MERLMRTGGEGTQAKGETQTEENSGGKGQQTEPESDWDLFAWFQE